MAAGHKQPSCIPARNRLRGRAIYILILDIGNPLIHMIVIHKKECFPPADLDQPTTQGNKSPWHRGCIPFGSEGKYSEE